MRNSALYLSAAVLGLLSPAPAEDKLRENLRGYERIEVAPFRNKIGDNLEQKTVDELRRRVVDAIQASKLIGVTTTETAFPKKHPDDDTKLAWTGTSDDQDARTLLLFSEVITFNKGSRAKRYLVGGGTGRAELRGSCFLLEKKTGRQISYFQAFGETNWGLAGGGADKTLKGYAGRIVGFLKAKY
jgi:hypothetical protein